MSVTPTEKPQGEFVMSMVEMWAYHRALTGEPLFLYFDNADKGSLRVVENARKEWALIHAMKKAPRFAYVFVSRSQPTSEP